MFWEGHVGFKSSTNIRFVEIQKLGWKRRLGQSYRALEYLSEDVSFDLRRRLRASKEFSAGEGHG